MLAFEPTHMLLGVKFEADAADQIELSFEEIDVMLLVLHQLFEQVARDVVLHPVTIGCGLLVQRPRGDLGGEQLLDLGRAEAAAEAAVGQPTRSDISP